MSISRDIGQGYGMVVMIVNVIVISRPACTCAIQECMVLQRVSPYMNVDILDDIFCLARAAIYLDRHVIVTTACRPNTCQM